MAGLLHPPEHFPPQTVLPSTVELETNPVEQYDRNVFFMGVYCSMIVVTLVPLTLRWLWFVRAEKGYSRALDERNLSVLEADETGEEHRESGEGYTTADIRFLAFDMAYQYCLLSVVVYALLNDFICKDTGLDWELYFPWFLEALISQLICAFLATRSHGKRRMWPMMLVADLLGERWNMLRDFVALGILLQAGTPVAGISFGISLMAMLTARWLIYGNSTEVKQMRLHYWPVASAKSDEQVHDNLEAFVNAMGMGTSSLSDTLREAARGKDGGCVWRTVVDSMFSNTCAFKQRMALVEQLPQAVSGAFFTVMTHWHSLFVAFSAIYTIAQAALIWIQRPYVVCWKARIGKPWQHLSAGDIKRARACSSWSSLPCSLAAAEVLVSPHTPKDVRLAAASALGHETSLLLEEGVGGRGNASSDEPWRLVRLAETTRDAFAKPFWPPPTPAARRDIRNHLLPLVSLVLVKLVEQLREDEFRELATHVGDQIQDQHADLAKGPASLPRWGMVEAILQHMKKANVNFCKMTPEDLVKITQNLKGPLALTYLNLSDNKQLCSTEAGLNAVLELLSKAPNLVQLKIANTGFDEAGEATLQKAWRFDGRRANAESRPEEGLVLRFSGRRPTDSS